MMRSLASGLVELQRNIRAAHTSGDPGQRRTLIGMVEMFRVEVLGPIDIDASLLMPLGRLMAVVRRYAATREVEHTQRDACMAEFERVLSELAVAAEHARVDPERVSARPDFDATPSPNPIGT